MATSSRELRFVPSRYLAALFASLMFGSISKAQLVVTSRTTDGVWADVKWSNGVPTSLHSAQVTGGTLTIGTSDNLAVGALSLTGGAISNGGAIAVASTGTFSGGTLDGTGTLTFAQPLTLSGTTLGGTGSVSANGGANMTNSFSIHAGQTLNLAGTSNWTAGTIYHGTGATLNNTGTINNTGNTSFYHYYGGTKLAFNNSGTFTKKTATGDTDLNAIVTNSGTISVETGTLTLSGGGSSTGIFDVSSNAMLQLSSGTFAFNSGSQINGTGTVQISGGTTTFSGANTGTANLSITGGTAIFGGTTSTNGGGTFSGGTLDGTGTLTFAQPLTLSGTTLGGTGSVSANGGANMTNSFSIHAGQTLNLAGTSNWTAGTIYHGTGATLNNTGTINNTGNTSFYHYYGGTKLAFNNSGTFIKKTATGDTDLNAIVTNTGTINVQTGTLHLQGGGSSNSIFDVASGAVLSLDGGTFAFNAGSEINGSGTVRITGGTTTFSGANTGTANLSITGGTASFSGTTSTSGGGTFSGGTLNGAGSLTFSQPLTLSGTTLGGTGSVSANGGANISSSFSINSGQTLNLANSSTWSADTIYHGTGAILNNTGTLTNTGNTSLYHYYGGTKLAFNNSGTFTKSTATGDTYLDAVLTNTGTINVQTGTLHLQGGGTMSPTSRVTAAEGARLYFANSHTIEDGAEFSGLGSFIHTAGTLTLNGRLIASSFNWSGGTWNAPAVSSGTPLPTTTIASGSTLILDGSANHTYDYRNLTNSGTVRWLNGHIGGGNGSVFTNAGTFEDKNASGYSFLSPASFGFGAGSSFVNTGTYVRDATNTTYFAVPFENNGTGKVQVVKGDLRFQAGGTLQSNASIAAAAGTNVYFENGFTIQNGASLTGLNDGFGSFFLTNGTFSLTGALNVSNFTQTGGKLAGTNSISGLFTWNGGNWNDTTAGATTTIANGGTLILGGSANHTYDFRSITNNGTVRWLNGHIGGGNGSVFTNAGTFEDKNASGYSFLAPGSFGFGAGSSFVNNGTYTRDVGNTTYFEILFNNNGTLTLSIGASGAVGDIQLHGGGTMSANSRVNAAAGTRLYFTNSYSIEDGAELNGLGSFIQTAGTLTVNGRLLASLFHWSGGTWNAPAVLAGTALPTSTLASGTTLILDGGANHTFDYRNITNDGAVKWINGHIGGGNGSVFTNVGTFEDKNASGYSFLSPGSFGFSGASKFVNTGTYVRDAANTTYIAVPFENNGMGKVQVLNGDMRFQAGGTLQSNASIAAAAGTNVYFENGFTIQNGASLTGLNDGFGSFFLTNGTLSLTGALNVSNFTQTGGKLAGTHSISGSFTWNGGNWNDTTTGATTTIANGGTLILGGNANHTYDYRSITNNGTVTWLNGHIGGGHGSVFTNAGVFEDNNASGYSFLAPASFGFGGISSFTNDGTYTRDVSGTTYFEFPFNNRGTLNLSIGASGAVGDIQLHGGGAMSASSRVNAAAGTRLYFTNSYTIEDGAELNGLGSFIQTAGTLTINGRLLASSFNWSGGNWNAPAVSSGTPLPTTTIASGTTLILDGGANHTYDFRNISNSGTVRWINGHIGGGNGSVFTNNSVFQDKNVSNYSVLSPASFGFAAGSSFINNGTYTRDVGGTTFFAIPFNNNGTLNLSIGATGAVGDIQLHGGGTMSANSRVNAAAGTRLYFTNNYTIEHGARFSGLGSFIQTGGTLTIDGALDASKFQWSGGNWNGPTVASGTPLPTTTIASGTTLILDAGVNHTYNNRHITNSGAVTWINGHNGGGNGSVFTNAGAFRDQNSSSYSWLGPASFGFAAGSSFVNTGSYTRDVGGTTTFQVPFTNAAGSAGGVFVTGGVLRFASGFTATCDCLELVDSEPSCS